MYTLRLSFLLVNFFLVTAAALAQPTQEWVARYGGTQKGQHVAVAVTADVHGNVYVIGQTPGEILSPVVTGKAFVTIKYDKAGTQLWSKQFKSTPHRDAAPTGIAVDSSGNVYVTGWNYISPSSIWFATIKYDSIGTLLWAKSYWGLPSTNNVATSIGIDPYGDVVVTGASGGLEGVGNDYVTIKYDTNGNEKWVRRYNSPEYAPDYPYSLAIGKTGSVYITGESNHAIGTIKYDKDGNLLWSKRYNRAGDSFGVGKKVMLDKDENVLVAGESFNPATNYDFVTIKYNADGIELWAQRYNGPQNLRDQGISAGVDASGGVYVTGFSYDTTNQSDYATVKYDAAGNQKWSKIYSGTTSLSSETPQGLATDSAGNTFVTGTSFPQGGDADYATVAYDSSGNELWIAKFNDAAGSTDEAAALAIDNIGNVYVTGIIRPQAIATIKYAPPLKVTVESANKVLYPGYEPTCTRLVASVSGGRPPYQYQWTPSSSQAREIEVCPVATTTYNVIVTDANGTTISVGITIEVIDVTCQGNKVIVCHNGFILCVPKEAVQDHLAHGDVLGAGNCKEEEHPVKSFRIKVAPNPFVNTTVLQYQVPEYGRVLILLFDGNGRLLSIPVNGERKPGIYNFSVNATHLQPGTYYYYGTFISKKGVQFETGKMIKIR